MYLVAAAWLYVTLMMAVAEATHANGSVLGAVITFLLYGAGPLALVLYLLNTPHRRRALRARDAAQAAEGSPASGQPDTGGQATAAAEHRLVPPEREKA